MHAGAAVLHLGPEPSPADPIAGAPITAAATHTPRGRRRPGPAHSHSPPLSGLENRTPHTPHPSPWPSSHLIGVAMLPPAHHRLWAAPPSRQSHASMCYGIDWLPPDAHAALSGATATLASCSFADCRLSVWHAPLPDP